MSCYCSGTVINKVNNCEGCLVVNSYRLPCNQGITPCGFSGTFDVTTNNDYSACDGCGVTYSIVSFDDGLENVTIDADGLISFDTNIQNYEYRKEYAITYKVDCPCSILSASATVYICMDHPCPDDCFYNCNPCDGGCLTVSDYEVSENGGGCDKNYTVDLASSNIYTNCDGNITYKVDRYSAGLENVSISLAGVLSYTISKDAALGKKLTIDYEVYCDTSTNMVYKGKVTISVIDPCISLGCTDSQECDRCAEACVDRESDLEVGASEATYKQSGVSVNIS